MPYQSMPGASTKKTSETAPTSVQETHFAAKPLDLEVAANSAASRVPREAALESERVEKLPEQDELDTVAVGAVAHVIRRAFHTLYETPEAEIQSINHLIKSEAAEGSDTFSENPEQLQSTEKNDVKEQQLAEESPYVNLYQAQKKAILQKREGKHKRATALLEFMELRQQEALEADARMAQDFSERGLVIKTQIPIGPTHLRLDDHEIRSAQANGLDFGDFADSLLHAKTLMVEYERKRDVGSGWKKEMERRTGKESDRKTEHAGYLNTTKSSNIRTAATLEHHQYDIADVKDAHAAQRAAAATTSPLQANNLSPNTFEQSHLMNPVEKRKNLAILDRMHTKLDFMRNPRYTSRDRAKKSKTFDKSSLSASPDSEKACFDLAPKPPIRFTTYDIGGMYEQTVYVRNTSSLSRGARICPPSTKFFSLASVKFPTDRNLIAPGMHLEVRIRFAPDSRADYKDSFTVQYEMEHSKVQGSAGSGTLTVPLVASREPPELTLPLVIHAQNSLVGGHSLTSLECKNLGGKARFWMLRESAYSELEHLELAGSKAYSAVTGLEREDTFEATIEIGPFSLHPAAFELDKGQSVNLELVYIPSMIGEQRERFVMVCDNSLVRVFQLVGRGCQIEIAATQVNDVHIDTKIPELGLLDRLYFSDEVIVNASVQQTIGITNTTPLDVKYSWQIHRLDNETKEQASMSTLDSTWTPPFRINPISGLFAQSSSKEFTIEFVPSKARTYACQATLMIHDIPACSMPGPDQMTQLKAALQARKQSVRSNEAAYAAVFVGQDAMPAISMQLHGRGKLGSFTITPTLIDSWNTIEIGKPVTKSIYELDLNQKYASSVLITNQCDARVAFCWDLTQTHQRHLTTNGISLSTLVPKESTPPFDLALLPLTGELKPLSHQRIEIAFTPFCTGSFSISIPCRLVTHAGDCSPQTPRFEHWLLLEGRVAQGEIEIISREVDFGLVLVGTSAESLITIRNPSRSVTTHWKFVHLEGLTLDSESGFKLLPQSSPIPKLLRSNSKDSIVSRRSATSSGSGNDTERSLYTSRNLHPRAAVTFAPEAGKLPPGESFIVKATCMAGSLPQHFRGLFRCQTTSERTFIGRKDAHATVSGRAEIQCSDVFISTTRLALGTSYLGVEIHRSFELVNASNLETAFKFVEPEGASHAYTATFAPKQGIIHSKERLAVTLSYTPRQIGRYTVIYACSVRGMANPVGFEVSSNHKGLVLAYSLIESPPLFKGRTTNSGSTFELPKSPKEIARERGILLTDCDLEPERNLSSNFPKLAFGDSVPLGERRVLSLLIQNFSGIEAHVAFEAKKFPVAVVDSYSVSGNHTSLAFARQEPTSFSNTNLKRTWPTSTSKTMTHISKAKDTENRFQSATGRAYLRQRAEEDKIRQMLRGNRGVAFLVSPANVSIPPWGQVVVQVFCFNNMPGTYVDDIVSRATGVLPVILHAHVNVVGSPLTLKRNCVGLYFNKSLIEGSLSTLQPTLRFGAVCVRSTPITKTLTVVNRGPQRARLKWKVVASGCEDQVVTVTLRMDFGSKLQLRITPNDHDSQAILPFTVEPQSAMVPAFGSTPFRVTFQPPTDNVGASRVVLLADAHWYDPKDEDDQHFDSNTTSTLASVVPSTDPRLEDNITNLKTQSNHSRTMAVGKAFAAVRMANALGRKPGLVSGRTPASSYSPKCLRVLLSADTIEPELFLDKPREQLQASKSQASGANSARTSPSRPTSTQLLAPYHIKFTTWSTLLSVTEAQHPFHRREIVLLNRLGTNVTFRLECSGPFAIANADSLAPHHPLSMTSLPAAHRRSSAQSNSYIFQLSSQMSVQIDLRFLPAASLIPSSSLSSQSKSLQQQMQPLHTQIDGELRVLFSTQSIQTIRLTAVVLRPALVVSPSIYSFGRVHLTTSRSVVVRLANPTVVPAFFSIHHVPRPKPISHAQQEETRRHYGHLTDEPEVFTFSQLTGEVRGPTTSLKSAGGYLNTINSMRDRLQQDTSKSQSLFHAPLELRVDFHPRRSDQQYQSRFRFRVEHGRDFEVIVKGAGHLDEEDEFRHSDRPLVRVQELEHSYHIFRSTQPTDSI